MKREDLDRILQQHQLWLESDGVKDERANLWGADLWGADLRGAKFSINIRDCWIFRHVKVTQDALPWLILHPMWTEFKDTVQILPT